MAQLDQLVHSFFFFFPDPGALTEEPGDLGADALQDLGRRHVVRPGAGGTLGVQALQVADRFMKNSSMFELKMDNEAHPLQQGKNGVGGLGEDAAVEGEKAEVAV